MSRVAVFETLAEHPGLNSLGISQDRIFPNYTMEERPVPTGPFIILRWGNQADMKFQTTKNVVYLNVWVHIPWNVTDDFSIIDNMLDNVDMALKPMWDVPGADGYTVTCVRVMGRGPDIKDAGFETITKNAAYEVLSRNT